MRQQLKGFKFDGQWALVLVLAALLAVTVLHASTHVHSAVMRAAGGARRLLSSHPRRLRLDVNPFPDAIHVKWLEGLEPLPSMLSPDSPAWSNSLALCAVMKDENITDVREWLQYYRWLGVNHVYLTDNGSADGARLIRQLRRDFPARYLTLRSDDVPHAQMRTYAWCAEERRTFHNWMAFFDLDEFLVLNSQQPLREFLDAFKHEAALSVHWVWVGSNGRATRPATGGVLPYYTRCSAEPAPQVKTIANMFYIEALAVHPHNFHYQGGRLAVDENHEPIKPMWKGMPEWKAHGGSDGECEAIGAAGLALPECFQAAGNGSPSRSAARIALYHYATKSLEDFASKMLRGSGMSKATKRMAYFAEVSRMQTKHPRCRRPAELAQRCCSHLYEHGGNPPLPEPPAPERRREIRYMPDVRR